MMIPPVQKILFSKSMLDPHWRGRFFQKHRAMVAFRERNTMTNMISKWFCSPKMGSTNNSFNGFHPKLKSDTYYTTRKHGHFDIRPWHKKLLCQGFELRTIYLTCLRVVSIYCHARGPWMNILSLITFISLIDLGVDLGVYLGTLVDIW